jgi:hypothetical protein
MKDAELPTLLLFGAPSCAFETLDTQNRFVSERRVISTVQYAKNYRRRDERRE